MADVAEKAAVPIEVGTPVADTISAKSLARLPEHARGAVWGEPTFEKFLSLYSGSNTGSLSFTSEAIAAMCQDADGNEVLTADEVGKLPTSVGLELTVCVKLLEKVGSTSELAEEVNDPKP